MRGEAIDSRPINPQIEIRYDTAFPRNGAHNQRSASWEALLCLRVATGPALRQQQCL